MINTAGLTLISKSESIRLKAYLCPAGVPTIGRGHTAGVTFEDVKNGRTITVDEERAMFQADMAEWEAGVRRLLKREPNENQLAAMVSLAFNIGLGAFGSSTVLKAFNRGDDTAAARAFGLWNKITDPSSKQKVVSNGLVSRRAQETALFLTPVQEAGDTKFPPSMPQEIAPPVTPTGSRINKSAVITGTGSSVALLTDVLSKINDFKDGFNKLGQWAVPLILGIVIAGAAWTLYERYKLRKDGVL